VVKCGDGDVIWIVGRVEIRFDWVKRGGTESDADGDGAGAGNTANGRASLFADLGGGEGGGVYMLRDGGLCAVREGGGSLGIAKDCVLAPELCESFFVWLLDPVEDAIA
jgi:hypothetical protein